MLTVLLLLFLCLVTASASDSIYSVVCTDTIPINYSNRAILEPVLGVGGRFRLKWCTEVRKDINKWKLDLSYTSVKPEDCNAEYFGERASLPLHSSFKQNITMDIENCTIYVCLTAILDAIFGPKCYYIDTQQYIDSKQYIINIWTSRQYQYVEENRDFTMKQVNKSKPLVTYQPDGEDAVLVWQLSIPASTYSVKLTCGEPVDVACSSPSETQVRCRARAPPGDCCAEFTHDAPWKSLSFVPHTFSYNFTHKGMANELPVPPQQASQWWWAAGALALALLLALLALLLLRAARAGTERENTLRMWIDDISKRWQRAGNARAAERLVLLYARDCAHATRAARTLAQLLQRVTDCDVVDLYAPETLAGAAPAGGAWLRALLARAGTRVLLLQSPALALYCARLLPAADGSPTLEAPLLGGRMAWRAPHAADSLLLLALRLLADSAHGEPLPYKKYYVAMTAGLQHDDAVPALTPQRRYRLPHAAATLLRDLSPDPALDPLRDPAARHLLEQYKEAMEDFRQYTVDHPNYLFEDLVVE